MPPVDRCGERAVEQPRDAAEQRVCICTAGRLLVAAQHLAVDGDEPGRELRAADVERDHHVRAF